jgi:hypothetical protein
MTFAEQTQIEFPEASEQALASLARRHRDRLLALCDWRTLTDAPGDRAAWVAYRQALRDAPQQAEWPNNPIPEAPTE